MPPPLTKSVSIQNPTKNFVSDSASVFTRFQSALAAHRAGRLAEAEEGYRQIVVLYDGHADAFHMLGIIRHQNGDSVEAEGLIRQALAIREDVIFLANLGKLLHETYRQQESEEAFRRALAVKSDFAQVHYLLALLLQDGMRWEESEAAFRRSIKLQPAYAKAHTSLGRLLLLQGRYTEAWPYYGRYYEYGTDLSQISSLPCPRWRDESLEGKSLLLMPSHGLGDSVLLIRYAPLLKALGVTHLTVVVASAAQSMMAYMASVTGVDKVMDAKSPMPAADYWTFPLNLLQIFSTTPDTIPATLPYLHVLPQRAQHWSTRLLAAHHKVGVTWKIKTPSRNDPHRFLPELAPLAPLWQVPGIHFVSLRQEKAETEAEQAMMEFGDKLADISELVALISQLDLIICTDATIAHIACAMGKPCWLLLPAQGGDWCWMLNRDDSPWYPGLLRLYRQSRNDWKETIDEIAAALAKWAARKA